MKTTKKERRIPEGWRRLTPTEKFTLDCKMCCIENAESYPQDLLNVKDVMWVTPSNYYLGKKASDYKTWIVITPKQNKQQSNEQPIETPPTSTPATT